MLPAIFETMGKLSPVYFLSGLFVLGLVWSHYDAAAAFKRCQTQHSLSYCQTAFWGR
jgi:hypothetical protein